MSVDYYLEGLRDGKAGKDPYPPAKATFVQAEDYLRGWHDGCWADS